MGVRTRQGQSSSEAPRRRAAFTLVELIVVIGVVMVLIGIWMPAIAGAWNAAQLTKWSSILRQGATAMQLYQNDWESYPLRRASAANSTHQWAFLVVELDYVHNVEELDPALRVAGRPPSVHMSMCVAVRAAELSPVPSPPSDLRSFAVRDDMIAFPSNKGILIRMWVDPTIENPTAFCCPVPGWRTPVAMSDGAVLVGTWQEFCLEEYPDIIDGTYGIPVYSTWGGYLARDR